MKQIAAMCVAVLLLAGGLARGQAIQFNSLGDAMRTAARERKPVAVFFSAPWCSWCKKMKTDSFIDPTVQNLARQLVWAEVNLDEDPVVASIFGAEGVPVLAFLNADGELLGAQGGYISPADLAVLLRTRAGQAATPGERRQRVESLLQTAERLQTMTDPGELNDAVRGLLELAADPHRELRGEVVKALRAPRTWPQLASGLDDTRLAIRAAAYDLLIEVTGERLPFDPFAPAEQREPQARAWQAWVEAQATAPLVVETPTTRETRP